MRMWIVIVMIVDLVESWVLSKLGSCEAGSGLIGCGRHSQRHPVFVFKTTLSFHFFQICN